MTRVIPFATPLKVLAPIPIMVEVITRTSDRLLSSQVSKISNDDLNRCQKQLVRVRILYADRIGVLRLAMADFLLSRTP